MSEVSVRFLGSGDAFGDGGRFQACLQLRGAGADVLVDCGVSSLVAMKQAGVDPSAIGFVLLTHLHGDHFGGLPFLILDGQFSRRELPLVIAGPAGTGERLDRTMEVLFPGSSSVRRRFAVEVVELAPGETSVVGPARVLPFEVVHESGAPSLGLRVGYGGRVVAFSGDTEWTDVLVELSRGADLFVCEAYTFDKAVPFHLSYRNLEHERARLEVRRLVLTHPGPELLANLDRVSDEVAEDGMVVEL
ncbi:MAG: MBL fold metallo-hydrolase [Actinomycetota bacterium]